MFLLTATCSVKAEPATKYVALVFDDGPTTDNSQEFLAIFEGEGIHVTFGYIGTNVEKHPDIAKTAVDKGHEIVNHSYAHLHPKDLNDTALEHDIVKAQEVIIEKVGYTPKWYWLPFVESDPRIAPIAAKVNLKVYAPKLVSSEDYRRDLTTEQIKQRAITNIADGTTILFHEFRNETVTVIPEIITELKRQGFLFLTFSQMAEYLVNQPPR
ncbi:MAG: polysaccharide deacetylase family protein [Candidatus Ratteibacteria bacterium]|nr:polysaccharide deacetylase family protein [Candidatus Ratteibacteria bacterium]